jgi:IMP dehydrogenase/GMP reductase
LIPKGRVSTPTGIVRSMAEGVPIIGAAANPLEAATEAALSYVVAKTSRRLGFIR